MLIDIANALQASTGIQLNKPLLPKEVLDIEDHFWISPQALLEKSPSNQ